MKAELVTTEMVLTGYRHGIFPMGDRFGDIDWYTADPRCVFEHDRFHIPHGLKPVLRKGVFETRVNHAFGQVIRACAQRDGGTWITPAIIGLYEELHARGHAHSVESWSDGELAGGLYGVALGGAFFGESMFYRRSDASKVALVALMERTRARGFTLVDTQWRTPHLARFGAVDMPAAEYRERLREALAQDCTFA